MSQLCRSNIINGLIRCSQVRFGSSLKVLLIENVVNRGQKGEIVKVKRGYFRNLLYPRKMAGILHKRNIFVNFYMLYSVYATDVNLERYKYLLKPEFVKQEAVVKIL